MQLQLDVISVIDDRMLEMKIEIIYEDREEIQVTIHCKEKSEEVERILQAIDLKSQSIVGTKNNDNYRIMINDIFYFESVDGKVFAYTKEDTYRVSQSLEALEQSADYQSFFRCGKSMIVNMDHIEKFKSTMNNRIIATLSNQEEVVISRHYAKQLRALLKD